MQPESSVPGTDPNHPYRLNWSQINLLAWTILVIVCCIHGILSPNKHNTFPYFRDGGLNWLAGQELYQVLGGSCRYSPLFHVLMIPLAVIPEWLGNTLWRLMNVGIFFYGIHCWIRHVLPPEWTERQRILLFLIPFPLALGSLHNGQANLLMVGFMFLTIAEMAQNHPWRASLWIVLATLLKLYPITLALVLLVVRPKQFLLPLLTVLGLGLLLPFLFGSPGYVLRQCGNWYQLLRNDYRLDVDSQLAYRDLWLLIRNWNLPISHQAYHGLQIAAGIGIALVAWVMTRRNLEEKQLLNRILAMVCCWIVLLGPATESCTYIVIAPILAWAIGKAWENQLSIRPTQLAQGFLLASLGFFLATLLAGLFPGTGRIHAAGLHPLGGLLLVAGLILQTSQDPRRNSPTPGIKTPNRQAA